MYGMSCVGKTYYAQTLRDHDNHEYYCFDAMFNWHAIETMGLSTSANLKSVAKRCVASKYVLDGWHLSDREGKYLPKDCMVYVVFAEYPSIIQQYRIEVASPEEHRYMFHKWYNDIPYEKFARVRYWENLGRFIERPAVAYQAFLARNR